jgi:hypothetical protein
VRAASPSAEFSCDRQDRSDPTLERTHLSPRLVAQASQKRLEPTPKLVSPIQRSVSNDRPLQSRPPRRELSPNLRGGGGVSLHLTTSPPSANFTPRMIFGNRLWPLRRRQLCSAASPSLKIMASAVLLERHPLERTVRWRISMWRNPDKPLGFHANWKNGSAASELRCRCA